MRCGPAWWAKAAPMPLDPPVISAVPRLPPIASQLEGCLQALRRRHAARPASIPVAMPSPRKTRLRFACSLSCVIGVPRRLPVYGAASCPGRSCLGFDRLGEDTASGRSTLRRGDYISQPRHRQAPADLDSSGSIAAPLCRGHRRAIKARCLMGWQRSSESKSLHPDFLHACCEPPHSCSYPIIHSKIVL